MGVIRSAYTAWVRFYPDQALTKIKWYFCDPSNPWFMDENLFYPWKEYKQFENTDGLGEITTLPRPWSNGADTGELDGSFINGDPLGFAGLLPYDPLSPANCDPAPTCEDISPIPPVVYLVITKVTCTTGAPYGAIGQVIPLHHPATPNKFWVSDDTFFPPRPGPVRFGLQCTGDNLAFVNPNTVLPWPAEHWEPDPLKGEFKDVPVGIIIFNSETDELWDFEVIT